MAKTVERRPVAHDLFRWSADGAALVGSLCTGCGSHYFPKSVSCRNPACADKSVSEALLGWRGQLYSYTVQRYQPPALFGMEPFGPYAIGLVQLPEGLRVLGMLTGCEFADIRIGMPLELTVETLYTDDSGHEILTYKYTPSLEKKPT